MTWSILYMGLGVAQLELAGSYWQMLLAGLVAI